jgi:hypothetical protein
MVWDPTNNRLGVGSGIASFSPIANTIQIDNAAGAVARFQATCGVNTGTGITDGLRLGVATNGRGEIYGPDSLDLVFGTSTSTVRFGIYGAANRLFIGRDFTPNANIQCDAGNATAFTQKFTAGSTTGTASTDGFDIGITSAGVAELRQREALSLDIYTNNSLRWSVLSSGQLQFSSTGIIRSSTADGTDNQGLYLAGGGDADSSRGAFVALNGNESAGGPGVGAVQISSGATATGSLAIRFSTNTGDVWSIPGTGRQLVFLDGDGTIRSNTADATDNRRLFLQGGGGNGSSRGGSVVISGNEAVDSGRIILEAGSVATTEAIKFLTDVSTGQVKHDCGNLVIHTNNVLRWSVPNSGNLVYTNTSGSAVIRADTADASDSAVLVVCGGGGIATSRGASISLYGNEGTVAGGIRLAAGSTATGADAIGITTPNTGEIFLQQGGTKRISVSTTGTIDFPNITTAITIGATGVAAALPALPLGYVRFTINGTEVSLPYYTAV